MVVGAAVWRVWRLGTHLRAPAMFGARRNRATESRCPRAGLLRCRRSPRLRRQSGTVPTACGNRHGQHPPRPSETSKDCRAKRTRAHGRIYPPDFQPAGLWFQCRSASLAGAGCANTGHWAFQQGAVALGAPARAGRCAGCGGASGGRAAPGSINRRRPPRPACPPCPPPHLPPPHAGCLAAPAGPTAPGGARGTVPRRGGWL